MAMTGWANPPLPGSSRDGGSSPVGLHRVISPAGVLPQAAERLDSSATIGSDEVRVGLTRLNLDAASFRQLTERYAGDGDAIRAAVLEIIRTRGKMHNPVTGSGGMLIGTVEEVGWASPLGLVVGDRIATLVSLTLTPLEIIDGLADWDGRQEQVPARGHAILFARSIAARVPDDLDLDLALAVFDVCGAPALTDRVVRRHTTESEAVSVAVLGGAGKSGSLALVAARRAGARTVGVVPHAGEAEALRESGLADHVAIADARDPVALAAAVTGALGTPATVTVVCVDVPGCEHGAILATAAGGTVIFFSMATSFAAAALGAEGLAADITMLIGNGYVPGHAAFALDLVRGEPALRHLLGRRLAAHPGRLSA
jgi:L-erythro-3,5-diaminohexanoate dehydrogenase